MKIASVSISNILSFAQQDGDLTPNLTLDASGEQGSLDILIGPNGSGKSNLIEIVNSCFRRALFQPVVFSEQNLMAEKIGSVLMEGDRRNTLRIEADKVPWNLARHHSATSESQMVNLTLILNDNDFNNLEFLIRHEVQLNETINRYSGFENLIPVIDPAEFRKHSSLAVTVSYTPTQRVATVMMEGQDDPVVGFIKGYLLYFRLFQETIGLYNRYKPEAEVAPLPPLKETFALLGSYRNYGGINPGISIESNRSFEAVNQRLRDESTRTGGGDEPAVFQLVKRKIGYEFNELNVEYSQEESFKILYGREPLLSINKLLDRYLNRLVVKIRKPNPHDMALQMYFERNGKEVDTSELSSGEKGIIHFSFALYGFDLRHGLLLIDEPELHLHPQIQRDYLKLVEEVQKQLDIQFVIATHSPIFINERTIEHVSRFFIDNSQTAIVTPRITAGQKGLTKILDLTNSSKIFFVTKAILVEGETDEYFLNFLLKYLQTNPTEAWHGSITDYEVFNIRGKGERGTWTKFLQEFGLITFFIGDWDNVSEVAAFDVQKYKKAHDDALPKAAGAIQAKGSMDGEALFSAIDKVVTDQSGDNVSRLHEIKNYIVARVLNYPALIEHLKNTDNAEWQRINSAIDAAYADNVYILRNGELEDYLNIGKGIQSVINFCQTDFQSWLTDATHAATREEIYSILKAIFPEPSQKEVVTAPEQAT